MAELIPYCPKMAGLERELDLKRGQINTEKEALKQIEGERDAILLKIFYLRNGMPDDAEPIFFDKKTKKKYLVDAVLGFGFVSGIEVDDKGNFGREYVQLNGNEHLTHVSKISK